MKAVFIERFGASDCLRFGEFPEPRLRKNQVLIAVHAASVNPRDWLIRSGRYVFKGILPRLPFVLGSDIAGKVVEVGAAVRRFKPGDQVMAMQPSLDGFGGYAERIAVRESAVAFKPPRLSFVEAAALPLAGLTALQALRDDAGLKNGQRVLIVGASGGVGTFAVQIAKNLGAEVVGVCGATNLELVRSLGADLVVDYRQEGFRERLGSFEVIFDVFGKDRLATWARLASSRGLTYVTTVPNARTMLDTVRTRFLPFGPSARVVLVRSRGRDLELLGQWAEAGKLRSVIDQVLPLDQAAELHDYQRTWRSRGKNVLEIVRD